MSKYRGEFPIDWEPIKDVHLEVTFDALVKCFGVARVVLRELAEQEDSHDILGTDATLDAPTWLARKLATSINYPMPTYLNRYSGLELLVALSAVTTHNLVGFSDKDSSYTLFPSGEDTVQRSP